MTRSHLFMSVALLLGPACGASIEDSSSRQQDALAQILTHDGQYLADREWTSSMAHGEVGFPSDPLTEGQYLPLEAVRRYTVAYGEDGVQITLRRPDTGEFYGGARRDDSARLHFELDQGVFAGGRFELWTEGEEVAAELTIYGSGLPIVASTRGHYLAAE